MKVRGGGKDGIAAHWISSCVASTIGSVPPASSTTHEGRGAFRSTATSQIRAVLSFDKVTMRCAIGAEAGRINPVLMVL